MFKKIQQIINKDNYSLIFIVFIGSILAAVLEIIGIGFIPVFAMMIMDPTIIQTKLPNYINLKFLETIDPKEALIWGGLLLTAIFIIKNSFLAFLFYLQGILVKKIRSSLAIKVFKLYINAPYKIHYKQNPAEILRNIDSETSGSVTIILQLITLFREILILSAIFLLLVFVDPLISFSVFLIFTFLVGIFFLSTRNIITNNSKILQKFRALKLKDINEALGAIKEVKIFNKSKTLEGKFGDKIFVWEKSFLINYILTCLPRLVLESTVIISVVLILLIFVFVNRDLNTIIPLLSLFTVSAIRMLPSFNSISTSLAYIKSLTPSLNVIVSEIQKLESFEFSKEISSNNKINFSKDINLFNISFKYNDVDKLALSNLNLKIKAGSKVGIIGQSGAGKSTFIDLILGLLKPTNGKILVDGKNISENINSWQSQIGYVPQDVYLLDDTIKNNIIFSSNNNEVNLNYLNKIVEITRLESLIKDNLNGIETFVGDKGARLSGGQKQRIGIARALYNNPKVIIFDEATSSLDLDNENKIIEEIFSIDRSKTLILVTHRHQVVKKCDIIFLFDNGKLIDQGSYDYLSKKFNFENFSR